MRITEIGPDHFVICRGIHLSKAFFCFFVDDDRACWSKHPWNARRYMSRAEAGDNLDQLRKRARAKRGRTQ